MTAYSPHLLPQTFLSTLHPVPWLMSPRAGGSGLSFPVCEIGGALAKEGGWEASGNWGEVQAVCTPEPHHGDTLQSSIPYCLRIRHPELRLHPTIPNAVLFQGSPRNCSPRWSAWLTDGCSSRCGNSLQAWLLPFHLANSCLQSSLPLPTASCHLTPTPQTPFYSRGLATGALKAFCFYKTVFARQPSSHWGLARQGVFPWFLCRWVD